MGRYSEGELEIREKVLKQLDKEGCNYLFKLDNQIKALHEDVLEFIIEMGKINMEMENFKRRTRQIFEKPKCSKCGKNIIGEEQKKTDLNKEVVMCLCGQTCYIEEKVNETN